MANEPEHARRDDADRKPPADTSGNDSARGRTSLEDEGHPDTKGATVDDERMDPGHSSRNQRR